MDQALTVEARWFAHILRSKEAAAMIRTLFLSKGELEKGARRPKNIRRPDSEDRHSRRGFMGAGVAYVSAVKGWKSFSSTRSGERRQGQGALRSTDCRPGFARPRDGGGQGSASGADRATPDYGRLKGCDLIVEAVFEDRAVKRKRRSAHRRLSAGCGLRLQHFNLADHLARANLAASR